MSILIYKAIIAILGFASGLLISGGVFAFISAIGIVPRMAQKTGTEKFIPFYEDIIVLGGIFGTTTMFIDYYLPIGKILVAIFSLSIGIFVGCLAIALAEVVNVMPIFLRRAKITKGLPFIILGLAIGKIFGSIIYFILKGFYVY